MPKTRPKEFIRTGLLSLWALATLILLFCVAFLVYEMIQKGQNPLDLSMLETPKAPAATHIATPVTTRDVMLYFAHPKTTGLVGESRRIEFSGSTVENCRHTLQALIDGPKNGAAPVLSPATKIRGMYLLTGGELVVDFSRELEAGHIKSASAELLMVQGIVNSLTQPALRGRHDARVRKLRFLFEGSPPQDRFPAHVDLSFAVEPDPSWIEAPVGEVPNA